MFDFEWTGRSFGDQSDHDRGVQAAQDYCDEQGLAPAQIWHDATEVEDQDAWAHWRLIENRAIVHLCRGWQRTPENVSLVWR